MLVSGVSFDKKSETLRPNTVVDLMISGPQNKCFNFVAKAADFDTGNMVMPDRAAGKQC